MVVRLGSRVLDTVGVCGPFPDTLAVARALRGPRGARSGRLVLASLLAREPLDDRLRVRQLRLADLEAARQEVRVLVRVRVWCCRVRVRVRDGGGSGGGHGGGHGH